MKIIFVSLDVILDKPVEFLKDIIKFTDGLLVVTAVNKSNDSFLDLNAIFSNLSDTLLNHDMMIYDIIITNKSDEISKKIHDWITDIGERRIENYVVINSDISLKKHFDLDKFICLSSIDELTEDVKNKIISNLNDSFVTIKSNVGFNKTGSFFSLHVSIPYDKMQCIKVPDSCYNCPVGYHSETCGKYVPFRAIDSHTRSDNCILKQISLDQLLGVIKHQLGKQLK